MALNWIASVCRLQKSKNKKYAPTTSPNESKVERYGTLSAKQIEMNVPLGKDWKWRWSKTLLHVKSVKNVEQISSPMCPAWNDI